MKKLFSYYTVLGLFVFGVGFGLSYSVCSLLNVEATAVQTESQVQSSSSMPMIHM